MTLDGNGCGEPVKTAYLVGLQRELHIRCNLLGVEDELQSRGVLSIRRLVMDNEQASDTYAETDFFEDLPLSGPRRRLVPLDHSAGQYEPGAVGAGDQQRSLGVIGDEHCGRGLATGRNGNAHAADLRTRGSIRRNCHQLFRQSISRRACFAAGQTFRIVTAVNITGPVHALYANRLRRRVLAGPVPRHLALIMDGNRRWARHMGLSNVSLGHRYGAEHVEKVLSWSDRLGIEHVTVFVCSTENLQRRGDAEVAFLMSVIEDLANDWLARPSVRWQLHLAGSLDLLPDSTARALKAAAEATTHSDAPRHVTMAIGYGGRQEIVDALRDELESRAQAGDSLTDVAESLRIEDVTRHLYDAGRPEPDLIVRTSGEQRMSNFLLWQSTNAELQFCDAYWPAFREIDLLRAVRSYGVRRSRRTDGSRELT